MVKTHLFSPTSKKKHMSQDIYRIKVNSPRTTEGNSGRDFATIPPCEQRTDTAITIMEETTTTTTFETSNHIKNDRTSPPPESESDSRSTESTLEDEHLTVVEISTITTTTTTTSPTNNDNEIDNGSRGAGLMSDSDRITYKDSKEDSAKETRIQMTGDCMKTTTTMTAVLGTLTEAELQAQKEKAAKKAAKKERKAKKREEKQQRKLEAKQKKKDRKDNHARTFFSNERTFLQWISFSTTLLSLGMALIGFTNSATDTFALSVGATFSSVAILFMVYAFIRWFLRGRELRKHLTEIKGYHDRFGPWFLTITIITAVVLVGILYFTYVRNNPVYSQQQSQTTTRTPTTNQR